MDLDVSVDGVRASRKAVDGVVEMLLSWYEDARDGAGAI